MDAEESNLGNTNRPSLSRPTRRQRAGVGLRVGVRVFNASALHLVRTVAISRWQFPACVVTLRMHFYGVGFSVFKAPVAGVILARDHQLSAPITAMFLAGYVGTNRREVSH
jgi:hypothetical protein